MSEPVQSERPDNAANPWGAGDDWTESEMICPDCGKLAWEAGWWDDAPECGGACIGAKYACGDCGWEDSH